MTLMDEVERRRFLDTLRRDEDFRATVRRELLTEELLRLPQTVAALVGAVAEHRQTVANLGNVVAQQRQDFTDLATVVRGYMERTITLIGEGFAATRAETHQMRAEMDSRFTTVDAGFAAVDARFDQVDADIREIKDRLAS